MEKYYFTFGFSHKQANGFYVIKAKNSEQARKKMFEKFGVKWAFQYDKDTWFDKDGVSQQEKWDLFEVT